MMMEPGMKQIDSVQVANAWTAARSHPVVATCVQITYNLAMGCGVSLGFGEAHMSDNELGTLGYLALQWLLAVGIVPVTFHKQDRGQHRPVIPAPEAVSLYVRLSELGQLEYEGRLTPNNVVGNTSTQGGGTHVFVWAKGKHLPTSRGKLTSPISQLESTERLLNFITSRTLIAENIRSNPHYVSQAKTKQNNDTDGVMWNVSDEVVLAAEQTRVAGIEANQRRQFQEHTAAWATGGVIDETGHGIEFDKQTQPREHFIAAERELVRQPLPESAIGNLHQIATQSEENIYRVFGLPVSVTKGNSHVSHQSALEQHALNTNMQAIRATVQEFLNDALNLSVMLPCEEGTSTRSVGFSTDPWEKGSDVEPKVTVLGALLVSQQTIFDLFERDIVTHQEMSRLLRRSVGLPAELPSTALPSTDGVKKRKLEEGNAATEKEMSSLLVPATHGA